MLYGETQSNTSSQFLSDIPVELLDADERVQRSITASSIGYTPIPVEEYPDDYSELVDGDKVVHTSFGDGVVVAITGGVATVCFKNPRYGTKKLALSIAPLKKVS